MNKLHKIYRIISNTIFYILIILLLVYAVNILIYKVIKQDKLPRIFNYYIFNVKSGSMEKNINVGDYIIVKKTNDIAVNDIVTYKKDNYFITHRVIKIDKEKVITKGDKNNIADDEIKKEDIIGKYICKSKIISFLIKNKFLIIGFIIITYFVEYTFNLKLKNKKNSKAEV